MTLGWWNWDGWPRADEWQAWWAFLSLIVTAVAALFAIRQLFAYIREQEERARPYLIVDFEFRSVLLYVTVQNTSGTVATNVKLRSMPMLQSTMHGRNEVLSRILGGGYVIPQIVPGRSIRWLVDRAPDLFNSNDLPHRVEVLVDYDDPRVAARPRLFRKQASGHYSERFVLDLDQYGEASAEVDYASKNWNLADRNEKRVEAIKKAAASVAGSLAAIVDLQSGAKASAEEDGITTARDRAVRRHPRRRPRLRN